MNIPKGYAIAVNTMESFRRPLHDFPSYGEPFFIFINRTNDKVASKQKALFINRFFQRPFSLFTFSFMDELFTSIILRIIKDFKKRQFG